MEPRVEARREAAKAGRRIYLGAKPCRTCEERERYTSSGQCVNCTKIRAARNDEEIRQLLREAKG